MKFIINIILGIISIIGGFIIIDFYKNLEKKGGLTLKLKTGGIGFIIIGIGLIFKAIFS